MSRLIFLTALILLIIAFLLFFPIVLESDLHFDLNKKKCGFSLFLFKKIKIIGGYAQTYQGGIALHVTRKKAILIPYRQMNSQRKKFSFIKTFRLLDFTLTTESGAEYLFLIAGLHAVFRIVFFAIGREKENVENNLWLTDGDTLRVSLNVVFFFNLFILLRNFIKFLKEKMKILWQKKMKKSTI